MCVDDSINLDSVLIQIKSSIGERWYDLGKALKTPENVLDKCKQFSPEQRLVEIVDFWIVNHKEKPTW